MTEFGHEAINVAGFCLDVWGCGPFVISAEGQSWRFEDSDRFGPALVKANGDIRSNPYPPERSLFWWAHEQWRKQGRRVADDGVTCVLDYRSKRPTKWRWQHDKKGRFREVIEEGDEGGGLEEITS